MKENMVKDKYVRDEDALDSFCVANNRGIGSNITNILYKSSDKLELNGLNTL